MVYKGYELLKAISDGDIKEGSRFKAGYETFIARDGYLFVECDNRQEYANSFELNWDFEPIENEIDIDSIEELKLITKFSMMSKINELVQSVNQLNKEVKELKETRIGDIRETEKLIDEAIKSVIEEDK